MIKSAITIASALLIAMPAAAQKEAQPPMFDSTPIDGPAQAPAGSIETPLYGNATPGNKSDAIETRFLGRETVTRNITYPTLTAVLPVTGRANGTAVIVAAGGGFRMLSLQNEGWRVAQKLADQGITAFVLKYRLLPTPKSDQDFMMDMSKMMSDPSRKPGERPKISNPEATLDALAALKLVRARSAEWHIDPQRVGMIGFSAGAMASLLSVLDADKDTDPATKAPDFLGYIYGPMDSVAVPKDAPPMFAALAMDDPLFGNGDFSIVRDWKAAGRTAELHAYSAGGHGYGMGKPGTTTTLMLDQFIAWIGSLGLLEPAEKQ